MIVALHYELNEMWYIVMADIARSHRYVNSILYRIIEFYIIFQYQDALW